MRALAPIMNAIEGNPLSFEEVPGLKGIRLARTTIAVRGLKLVPAMRVWFRATVDIKTVYLLYVELAPPEDMAIGDSL